MKRLNTLLVLTLSLVIVAMSTNSCKKDDEPADGIVSFTDLAINRTTDDLSAITVIFTIDPQVPKASEFSVSLTGAEAGTVFTTTPAMSGGAVTVSVDAGVTTANFTVTPLEAGIGYDDVVLQLSLSSAGDGLQIGVPSSLQINIANTKDTGEPLPFLETFPKCADDASQDMPPEGWTEEVVQQNNENSGHWRCIAVGRVQDGIECNAFVPKSTDPTSCEVWMLSPRLDLIDATSPVLNFDVDRRFNPTAGFTEDHYDIVISTGYTGLNFGEATWTRFQAGYDAMTANDPAKDGATSSGDLDLSAYKGEVITVAFIYRAGAPGSFDATILRIGPFSVTDQ